MKTAAIIAEYNPFHEGHKYQIQKTKELTGADYIVAIMSGNFVQRGGPAVFNKYIRTRMALLGGADAVIELPSIYAASSAEYFAQGAVTLLHDMNMIDYLCFGSESGVISDFQTAAVLFLEHAKELAPMISSYLKEGLSYPKAREKAVLSNLKEVGIAENFLSTPNNILGLEYCKSLHSLGSPITPITIKRQGLSYHDTDFSKISEAAFPSASALRAKLEQSATQPFLTMDDFSDMIRYRLTSEKENGFSDYMDCTPDLSDKIVKNLPAFTSVSEFSNLLSSKDLTEARVRRVLFHIFTGQHATKSFCLPFEERRLKVPYLRLLGFRKDSAPLLSEIKKRSVIPLISKLADASLILDPDGMADLTADIKAADLYEMTFSSKYKKEPLNEYQQSPIIL